jgi:hypothetical protein
MSNKDNSQTPVANITNALKVDMQQLDLILDFAIESKLPFVIWGVKAVGKTTKIYDAAARRGYRLEVLHLATQDIVDLIGMMAKVLDDDISKKLEKLYDESTMGKDLTDEEVKWVKDTMMNGKQKTIWTRPEWLHNDDDIPTLYFLDEMNRGNKFVSAAMLPFLLEGRMHQHRIGKNDVVIAACNPSTGKYSVNDAFAHDEALKDRCGHVILEPTTEEFLNYASDKIDAVTFGVLKKTQNCRFTNIGTFDLNFKVEPSRRSLINVMQHVGKKEDRWLRKYGRSVIGCYLGTEFLGVWWEAKFQNDVYLTIEDLMKININAERKQKVTDAITAIVNGKETVKLDIYEASLDTVVMWFEKEYKDGSSKLNWLTEYFSLACIPKDSIVSTLSKIDILKNPFLVEHFFNSGLLDQVPEMTKYHAFETLLKGKK